MTKVKSRSPRRASVGRRERQKLATRERIRAAAWHLFTTTGYERTTTKMVAERAGVAAGTVFVHARDKVDLLFLVMHERLARTVEAQMATLPRRAPLLEQLLHLFRGLFHLYGQHAELSAAFLRALPGAKGPNAENVGALTFAVLHHLGALVREAQARGEVAREIEPLLAANNLFQLYFGALIGWLNGFATLETALDPGLRLSLGLQLRGLRP